MEGSKEKTLAKMDAAAKEAETKLEALLENMDFIRLMNFGSGKDG